MGTTKTLISVLYLFLYSTFSVAELSTLQKEQIEKGLSASNELLTGLGSLSTKLKARSAQPGKTIATIVKVFDGLSKIASSLGAIGALVSFTMSFILQTDPNIEFIKNQLAEVNRKLDSIQQSIISLEKTVEWANYASVYSTNENIIRNSWNKWKEYMDSAPLAKTEEEKRKVRERFTHFYSHTGTESSVMTFHRILTHGGTVGLNRNLLKLIIEKSNGDLKTLVDFSCYFTALMVSGLQMNVFYYTVMGYDVAPKVEEVKKQLSSLTLATQAALLDCANDFKRWAEIDVKNMITASSSPIQKLDIKDHLDKKFNFYDWTVIVHPPDTVSYKTYGNFIEIPAHAKGIIYLLPQRKGTVDESIKMQMITEWESRGRDCSTKTCQWPNIFSSNIMEHIDLMFRENKWEDVSQTANEGHVQGECDHNVYTRLTKFSFYLKRSEVQTAVDTIGGNSAGAPCDFPFTFNEKTYTSCTSDGISNGQKWCSTYGDYDTHARFGFCPDVKSIGRSRGKACRFPFIYRTSTYNNCIFGEAGFHSGLWCATTNNYDKDEEWEWCQC